MKLLSRSGLTTVLCLATFMPLCLTHAAPAKKAKATPDPKPEPALEAEFTMNPPELSPASTIEVVFPTPMIAKERVGSAEGESPLVVSPALKGDFQWVSTRSGHFKLTEAPKFNASYEFALRKGLVDLAGKALSTDQLASVSSAQFRVIDQSPKWFDSSDANRTPKFVFEFNDAVDVSKAAAGILFVSEKPALKVAAKVRHATGKDFGTGVAPQPTWAEEIAKVKPTITPEAARLSALVVEPASPLPVATNWKLTIATTLTNSSGHDTLAQGDDIALGEVTPFNVTSITAHTPFDSSYYIDIDVNKALYPDREEEWKNEELEPIAQKLAALVVIEPNVAVKPTLTRRTLRLEGNFDLNKPYRIVVDPRVASGDGLALEKASEKEITFVPNPPYVAAPAFVRAQLAKGLGDYEISAANVREVRVRVKKLTGPELLQAMGKYHEYRTKYWAEDPKKLGYKPVGIDDYAGTQILDKTFPINKPLDKSELIKLNWKEILAGAPTAPLFVEVEGRAAEGLAQKGVITQSLIQFTDLGLLQKSNGRETMVFATSLSTGKPVAGVRMTMVDHEQKLLGYADTDANGLANLKGNEPSLVLAEKDGDSTAIQTYDSSINGVIPYDIPTAWKDVWKPSRRTFVFVDRPLYRPGDTAHLKAHTRLSSGDDLSLDREAAKAHLIIRDARYRVVMDKEISFTASGSWADDVKLPESPLGWYSINLRFDNSEDSPNDMTGGDYGFRVDDYKPNTFEVKLDSEHVQILADRMKLPMSAGYLMGKALSRAKVSWSASSMREYTPPEAFQDFQFGDAPRWAHYGKDRDADGYFDDSDSDDDPEGEWWVNGDLSIDDDGTAVLEMPMPPPDRASLPQQVHVSAEVTDINQQTITASTKFEVPGADFIIGLKGPQFFGRAGQDTSVEIIGIDSKGAPAPGAGKVDVRIERQEYHTLKIATAGGGSTTKDQVILREELKQQVDLKPVSAGSPPSATLPFKPTRGGTYFVTAETSDSKGRKVLSRMPLYVIGGDEFPWAMEDGARMLLQPEKKKLKPGEEAVIVVKTPIAGTALVSVERNKIHHQFLTQISPEQPVIKVPVQDAEAPNVYVSVILVRGSDASPKKNKMPEYKLGYCELEVESHVKELKVTLNPSKPEVKPAEHFAVAATVTDHQGKPVANSEITLYAVDEGVLSLMSHETPDPSSFFHAPAPLAIHNYASYDDILPEEFSARERGNKGFLIGGGGDESDAPVKLRKNFVATPLWLATAMTDASGQVTTDITAPDNLTRYRLMAVAVHGADRFGNGESSFKINKPLMVDPVIPRFARLGDETLLKAVLHNTTPASGEVEVTLELDATADFIREERFFIPASIKAPEDPKVWKQKVALKANETSAVSFPVVFTKLGDAKWKWTARTTTWSGPALDDGTESVLAVNHPVPELREVRYARIGKDPAENLLANVNPSVLEGDGLVSVSVSTSRLFEARDALEYILKYPYGCAEQTSSATLPWLALGGYQPLFPDLLSTDKTKDAVQKGVNRLLTMVTDEGGLAYWPGGQESSFWGSAYGGFMLLRARDAGANVPSEVIDKLTAYLSKKLRGLEDEKDLYITTDSALALYTLAKAKKPEPAYQNLLHAKRDRLPEAARLYTALAMCLSNTPDAQIKEMLGWKPPAPPASADKKTANNKAKAKKSPSKPAAKPAPPVPVWSHWAGNGANRALRLIVYTHLGLTSDAEELAKTILQSRNGRGEWGNTYSNAWTLTALAAYERSLKKTSEPVLAKVLWDTQQSELNIPAHPGSAKVSFPIDPKLTATPMKIELPAGRELFSRIDARSHPQNREFKGENKGYAIERTYEKVLPDGSVAEAEDLRVGDMVVISLTIDIGGGDRYLAINDPLPSVLEAINPEFETQNSRGEDQLPEGIEAWFCDHREIHADRALFFTDYAPQKGKFQLRYLARVIAEGDTIAPPAKIEAMYQPDKYGLSPTQHLRTLPSGGGQVAGK
ncbi:MAG: alpha-2-macroglobulin family protein [Verrucomicrobiota bacterium]